MLATSQRRFEGEKHRQARDVTLMQRVLRCTPTMPNAYALVLSHSQKGVVGRPWPYATRPRDVKYRPLGWIYGHIAVEVG